MQLNLFDSPPATRPDPELERRDSLRNDVLDRLRRGPAHSYELVAITHRFGARIEELRKAGHAIDAERVGGGVWRYTLRT
jgi:hypothetical protein